MTDESAVRPLEFKLQADRPAPDADPLDMLLQVLVAAESDEALPPAAARWLIGGVRMYLDGTAVSLDKALLGATKPGKRSIATRWRLYERDRHLRSAHSLCAGESDWARSCQLVTEVKRFASIIWPRWRTLTEPPADASALRSALFHVFKQGLRKVPQTAPGIHAIAKRTTAIRFVGDVEN